MSFIANCYLTPKIAALFAVLFLTKLAAVYLGMIQSYWQRLLFVSKTDYCTQVKRIGAISRQR